MSENEPAHAAPPSPGQERRAARERARGAGERTPPTPDLLGGLAFATLADHVREYAVFLLDPAGAICHWGESARLMQWWTKGEAEGSHLRLLYPEGGSEDGTAEAHLAEAAATGEYTGEGQRVRGDGSTFWAYVTLTALRGPGGELVGFAKTARDLTLQRAAEAALAIAWAARAERDEAVADAAQARQARDLAREDAELAHELVRSAREYASQVLEPELVALLAERTSLLGEMATLNEEIQSLLRPMMAAAQKPGGRG